MFTVVYSLLGTSCTRTTVESCDYNADIISDGCEYTCFCPATQTHCDVILELSPRYPLTLCELVLIWPQGVVVFPVDHWKYLHCGKIYRYFWVHPTPMSTTPRTMWGHKQCLESYRIQVIFSDLFPGYSFSGATLYFTPLSLLPLIVAGEENYSRIELESNSEY